MRRIIVTEAQLKEFVERKKAEKIYYNIIESLHKNMRYLNENISLKNVNQCVIDSFKGKNLINERVHKLLIENKIINENYEII